MAHSNKEILANVYAIETFGAFDGPGVRFILFLQGCPFKCQFCHNRDSWSTKTRRLMSVDEILTEYHKYKHFYNPGGITVSGGEPLLQTAFLIELFRRCKELNIHTCLDTSAACYDVRRSKDFETLMQYTDLILLDIKHIDDEKHKVLVGDSNKRVLEFALFLDELSKDIVIRHVLLPTINSDQASLVGLRTFIDKLKNVVAIDVLPYHRAGIMKWEQLGLIYPIPHIKEPTKDEVLFAEHILKDNYKFKKQI